MPNKRHAIALNTHMPLFRLVKESKINGRKIGM